MAATPRSAASIDEARGAAGRWKFCLQVCVNTQTIVPWSHCTARSPPEYGLSPSDHVQVCAPGSKVRPPCDNPKTGRRDLGLGVQTGGLAPDFALARTDAPSVVVRLHELLAQKKMVLVQFGAYT